ncbi:hypothetical protein BDV93DRAFT_515134 [Ceratobasidium sp. AG-I]|nr:hypothetical protein BDV93DRAFT_515134 [Ceratobasidium sp. AG-I]
MSAREERAASRSRRGWEHGHSDDEDDNTARVSASAPGAPQRDPNQEPTNFEIYSLLVDIQRELSGIRDIQDSHTTDLSSLIRVIDSIAAVPRIQSAPPGCLAGPSGFRESLRPQPGIRGVEAMPALALAPAAGLAGFPRKPVNARSMAGMRGHGGNARARRECAGMAGIHRHGGMRSHGGNVRAGGNASKKWNSKRLDTKHTAQFTCESTTHRTKSVVPPNPSNKL